MRQRLVKRALAAAVVFAATLFSVGTATAAHAAAGQLRVSSVHCDEQNDDIGGDSPYFLVFAGNPTNPSATKFGKFGPGSMDNEVDGGETWHPNGLVVSGVSSTWVIITIMLEEDDGNDLSAADVQNMGNAMHNRYQVSFWKSTSQMRSELRAQLWSLAHDYTGNDDVIATSVGLSAHYTGDADYHVTFTIG